MDEHYWETHCLNADDREDRFECDQCGCRLYYLSHGSDSIVNWTLYDKDERHEETVNHCPLCGRQVVTYDAVMPYDDAEY